MQDEKRLESVKSLNWDYKTSANEMLDVIDGKREQAGIFDREIETNH
jgi:hypothetical protein